MVEKVFSDPLLDRTLKVTSEAHLRFPSEDPQDAPQWCRGSSRTAFCMGLGPVVRPCVGMGPLKLLLRPFVDAVGIGYQYEKDEKE